MANSGKINQEAMAKLLGGLTSPVAEQAETSASQHTLSEATPSTSSKPVAKRGRPKKNPQTEQLTMMIDISLMDKVRALAFQETFSIKEIFEESVYQFISNYENRFGELKVAKRKVGDIKNLR